MALNERNNKIWFSVSRLLIGLICLLGIFLISNEALAQEPEPEPLPSLNEIDLDEGQYSFTLAQYNINTFDLVSPGTKNISLRLPYYWEIGEESYIELNYDAEVNNIEEQISNSDEHNTKSLIIYVDDVIVASLVPVSGKNQTLRVPLPPRAFSNIEDNSHTISFAFTGDCDPDLQSWLVIHDNSTINLDFSMREMDFDLADFPFPLIQDSLIPETVLIIVPDDFTEADLAAAAYTARVIGNKSSGRASVALITASEAHAERLGRSSAVFIGEPTNNLLIKRLYDQELLSTTLDGDQISLDGTEIASDDGVLQVLRSDLNPYFGYLVITGESETAVMRAAQALSMTYPAYGLSGSVSVIAEFNTAPLLEDYALEDNMTLEELGLEDKTNFGIDDVKRSVTFFLPGNVRLTDDTELRLHYTHSAQLSPTRSGIIIQLNNREVGSVAVDPTIQGEQEVIIPLSQEDFLYGNDNRLSFRIITALDDPCADRNIRTAWFRIITDSILRLSYTTVSEQDSPIYHDPMSPLLSDQLPRNIWYILPQEPTLDELNGMVKLSWMLGFEGDGGGREFRTIVSLDSSLYETPPEDYHAVVIGRPTANAFTAAINDQLPQSFISGEDVLKQEVGNIVYRLPEGYSLGVVEVIDAPWNINRAIIVVTGTTQEGVLWALNALTDEELFRYLEGDVSFIRGDLIESINTNLVASIALETFAGSVLDEEVTLEQDLPDDLDSAEQLIEDELPGPVSELATLSDKIIAGVMILIVALIGIGVFFTLRRRPSKQS